MRKDKNKRSVAPSSLTRDFEILNTHGIHARPAALLVKTAAKFACEISVEKDGIVVSAKSIMGLLTLEGHQGAFLKVTAAGTDAKEALDAIEKLMKEDVPED
ncbi:MAG: HPr family phosphocarrier protein [Kiritimatiellae bacterium]|nr:HPr family phosphocarrier protein [Kiritimatiellia bacterium]